MNPTLKVFLELTHLEEISGDKNDSITYIKELLRDHESIIIHAWKTYIALK